MAENIIRAARAYLGVRFRHQGRTEAGIDCAGLIILVARDLGLFDLNFTAYSHAPDGRTVNSLLHQYLDEVAPGEMRLGDVVFMAFQPFPQHLGILADAGKPFSLIHAYAQARMVIEHRLDDDWMDRIRSVHRFRGVP
ncbi:MAG: C40 family peptidase [Alphaproteobacteria bacterium]|nr:C40 family peptidase [Alphaproteobacteria bacterium]